MNDVNVPAGYKSTDIGVIPEDWIASKLGDIAVVSSGGTPSRSNPSYWNGNIPWITTTQIDFNTIFFSEEFITKLGLHNSSAKLCNKNTLLMAMYGQGKTRGKVAILGIKATINQACASIQINRNNCNQYIFFYLSRQYEEIRKLSNTGNQENLNGNLVKTISLPLPPLPEQKAIARVLSDVDELIRECDSLLAKKRDIKQGTMQQLLTGKKRLSGFSGEWEQNTISSVTPRNTKYGIVDGPFGSNLKTIHYQSSGIPIITSGYVTKGFFQATNYLYVNQDKFNQEKRSAVFGGDIVMAKIGARCGASAILPLDHETGILSGNALKITVDRTRHCTYFLWQLLWNLYLTGKIELFKTTGAQPAISIANLKNYTIPLPTLSEQKAIAQILSDMDAEIESLEKKRDKYKAIKQGMMQELLTGKTRLIDN